MDFLPVGRYLVAQPVIEQCLAHLREVRIPSQLMGSPGRVAERRRLQQFEILLVLCGRAAGHIVDPIARMPLVEAAESIECGEELIVPAVAQSWAQSYASKRRRSGDRTESCCAWVRFPESSLAATRGAGQGSFTMPPCSSRANLDCAGSMQSLSSPAS